MKCNSSCMHRYPVQSVVRLPQQPVEAIKDCQRVYRKYLRDLRRQLAEALFRRTLDQTQAQRLLKRSLEETEFTGSRVIKGDDMFEQLNFREWPFRTTADEAFASVWAGRAKTREQIDRLLRKMQLFPKSGLHVLWANLVWERHIPYIIFVIVVMRYKILPF
jgi:hypothetical protein